MQLLFSITRHKKSQNRRKKEKQEGKEKDSFLAQNQLSNKPIITSSITNRISPRFWKKRATPCISSRGSVTIEASLVLPIFLYGVLCIIYLLEILAVQMSVRTGMHEVYQNLAQEMYLVSYISVDDVETQIIESIGSEKLDNSIVVDGSQGLDCTNSSASMVTGILTLQVDYQVGLPVPAFLELGLNFSETLMGKGWTGYAGTNILDLLESETIVYITDNVAVYHISSSCTHLLLSISSTTLGAVTDQRNEDGGKYYACELCDGDATSNGVVYITNSGNAYHSNLSCSGLKRSIYAVPISEVIGKGVCSRCGAN